jgi:putative transposase
MRKLRKLLPGATYHVYSEIDHNAMALKDPDIKRMFLDMVIIAKKKFSFKLWNFTILDNRIDFLIRPDEGVSLSKIMQWLKSNFAKMWNKKHNTSGHLWGERFFSRIIENEQDFKNTFAFIDELPVAVGLAQHVVSWEFGGLSYWLQKSPLVDDPLVGLRYFVPATG